MRPFRAMLSALVAVAIALAPIGVVWARGAMAKGAVTSHSASHSVVDEDSVAAAVPMDDCASMMKGKANPDDCPCCDKDKACLPQFCIAKSFQFLVVVQQPRQVGRLVTALLRPTVSAHPPDWLDEPPPPPPRT